MQPEHGKAPGEFATAFPRLPRRACALLAMTREEGTPKFVIASLAEQGAAISQYRPEHGKAPAKSKVPT